MKNEGQTKQDSTVKTKRKTEGLAREGQTDTDTKQRNEGLGKALKVL